MKRIIAILLILIMTLTSATGAVFADAKAKYVKSETVYGNLNYNGSVKSLEVVNRFEVSKGGTITDNGRYSDITNLTDKTLINNADGQVTFNTDKDDFYYKGLSTSIELPWNYQIVYSLDGTTVSPEDLAGAEGHLKISIKAMKNPAFSDTSFYKHFVTQISVSLPEDKTERVRCSNGTLAEAGKNQQITFTVLPDEDGDFYVSAYIEDFEMDGISIAAIPYSMKIDSEDMGADDLTSDFEELTDATNKLKNGAKQLSNGMDTLAENGDLFTDGLTELQDGLIELGDAFGIADTAMSNAMASVPAEEELPTEAELGALGALVYTSGDENAMAAYNKLLACYQSLMMIKGTYDSISPVYAALSAALNSTDGSVVLGLATLGAGLAQYVSGIKATASGTRNYAKGMKKYAKGVSKIPDEMQDQIDEMLDKYNGQDFKPNSFTSKENAEVQSVQFVLTTEEISLPDKEDNGLKNITKQEKNDGGFLGRLKKLFGF